MEFGQEHGIMEMPKIEESQLEVAYKFSGNINTGAEKGVQELERLKLEILKHLEEDLQAIKNNRYPEKLFKEARKVDFSELSGGFGISGERTNLTKGEIFTDAEWDTFYKLGPSVDQSVRADYIKQIAAIKLRNLLDRQIAINESHNFNLDEGKRKAYQAREMEPDETHNGLVAEKIVRCMLKKISIDSDDKFFIKEVAISDDVNNKIDFIIQRVKHNRGVGVKQEKDANDIGIQLTTNSSRENTEHKKSQINKVKTRLGEEMPVNDLVLITIPIKNVIDLLNKWKARKVPGGPDKLWDKDKREKIIRGVLDQILPSAEIQEICSQLKMAA